MRVGGHWIPPTATGGDNCILSFVEPATDCISLFLAVRAGEPYDRPLPRAYLNKLLHLRFNHNQRRERKDQRYDVIKRSSGHINGSANAPSWFKASPLPLHWPSTAVVSTNEYLYAPPSLTKKYETRLQGTANDSS